VRRRLLAPEVIQTSAMDCGPAALKCLLEGFGVPVSYGRLREACQTDVDGTSIDTLEDIARQLGLEAEQIILPRDHLLLEETGALPAIIVMRLPNGFVHFVILWRGHGPLVQVMDPATGRRWMRADRFLDDVHLHTTPVAAAAWRAYAAGPDFTRPLRTRLERLGARRESLALIRDATSQPGWRGLAALDAATRMVDAVVRSGGLDRGALAARTVAALADAGARADGPDSPIPAPYWSVRPAPPDEDGEERIRLVGAVLVRVRGRRPVGDSAAGDGAGAEPVPLAPDLAVALAEPPARPGRELWRLLRASGALAPPLVLLALAAAATGLLCEALLLRGFIELGRDLAPAAQRLAAVGGLLAFLVAMLLLELPTTDALARLGRHLECRLRLAFLAKIPRLGDRYFHSRPVSDMAARSHSIHNVRTLPTLAGRLVGAAMELGLTAAGIVWLDPASAPLALAAAAVALAVPLAAHPAMTERDLRVRVHVGALGRFYLDALLGLMAVRAHGGERSVRREHESLLCEWVRAGRHLVHAVLTVEAAQAVAGFALAAWLLFAHVDRAGPSALALLLVYWALNLPMLGQEIALLLRQLPAQRNQTLRLLEPLAAPEAHAAASAGVARPPGSGVPAGVAIVFEGVTVRAGGQTILEDVCLDVPAGSHVGIVGPSGAGKSSLVGLLLGWHRPAAGRLLVDGFPLSEDRVPDLRRDTAWVDPAVQLWNGSLLGNLAYGARSDSPAMARILADADLHDVLARLPDGLQTRLGEGGGLVAGGEGQRVRFGRALMRPGARLVILDEGFRGLDREQRRLLLQRARAQWRAATLLCITHDVDATRALDRVVVIEGGRVIEDGAPAELAQRAGSRYRALLDAEAALHTGLWGEAAWRRLRLERGELQ
jgi:ATP-binding cassette subfamily B protein